MEHFNEAADLLSVRKSGRRSQERGRKNVNRKEQVLIVITVCCLFVYCYYFRTKFSTNRY